MEEKKRITLRIAGQTMSIVTDDDEETVRAIEKELDERIAEFGRRSPRMATKEGKMSAAILCAVEAMSRDRTQETSLTELERQLRLTEDALKNERARCAQLQRELAEQAEQAKRAKRAERSEQPERTEQTGRADGGAWETKYRALFSDYEKLSARLDALTASQEPDGRGAEEKLEAVKNLLLARKERS
ncbi:MAG: cell division protein ZapA [Clostridia bacterium]|nr:cell division protein ZapA [Clostridia bacterium]